MLAVLEGEVSADGAAKLLNLTGGDVARAINMHYDCELPRCKFFECRQPSRHFPLLLRGSSARCLLSAVAKPAPTNQPKASSTSKRSAATSPSAAQTPRKKRPTSLGSTGSQMSIMSFIGGRAPRAKAVGALAQGRPIALPAWPLLPGSLAAPDPTPLPGGLRNSHPDR